MEKVLRFTYDNQTIDHLGVKLYSTIPPMLAELISNAWDADAHNVYISLENGSDKRITVKDDGTGMSFDDLNEKFLKIGRNRRLDLDEDKTLEGRLVLGKKGLGKLSMFGIGKQIMITSVKDGFETSFLMDYDKIRANTGSYEPEIICAEKKTSDANGTTIVIDRINRKSDFDLAGIEQGIRDRFHIFSPDFVVHIGDEIVIDNCKISEESYQFSWHFPDDYIADFEKHADLLAFAKERNVTGSLYTAYTPLKSSVQGIVLFSRNKLVQENKTFDKRGNDNFFLYMTGSFDVDFIDNDKSIDNCSTDRKSLAWDNYNNDDLDKLKSLLEEVVSITQTKWRKQRKEKKKENLKTRGEDIDKWLESLTPAEKPLAKKLVDAIIENDDIKEEQAEEFIENIRDMYGFKSFQDFTAELSEMDKLDDDTAIKLLTDWQIIESKEYARVAIGRLETINQFEKFIKEDASETKVIQKFLEEFPWLLDPRMSKFDREVTFSKILKENFPDEELPEHDRRMDFLCTNDGGLIRIIELKRPSIKITSVQLNQIAQYVEFIKNHYPGNAQQVQGYLISDKMTYDPGVQLQIEALESKGIYVKSYSDLLAEARRYNKQFYDVAENIELKKLGEDNLR